MKITGTYFSLLDEYVLHNIYEQLFNSVLIELLTTVKRYEPPIYEPCWGFITQRIVERLVNDGVRNLFAEFQKRKNKN
jgi:hypothetical protein